MHPTLNIFPLLYSHQKEPTIESRNSNVVFFLTINDINYKLSRTGKLIFVIVVNT